MEEEVKREYIGQKDITLKQYLDSIGVHSGDDRGFVLLEGPKSHLIMEVSRRYISCKTWRYLLDRKVIGVSNTYNMYGQPTIMIVVESKDDEN